MHKERLSTCKFNPAPEMTDGLETVRLNGSRSISSNMSFVDMLISIFFRYKKLERTLFPAWKIMEILSNSLARLLPVSTAADVAVSLLGDSVVPQTKCSQFFSPIFPYFLCIH